MRKILLTKSEEGFYNSRYIADVLYRQNIVF